MTVVSTASSPVDEWVNPSPIIPAGYRVTNGFPIRRCAENERPDRWN